MDAPQSLLKNTSRACQVSPASIKDKTSEISSDTIKSLFTSLKKLGFEKMQCFCEHTFIKGVTEEDIRNLVTQSGLDNEEVKIDWLFGLTSEGVEKIRQIIVTLKSHKQDIFNNDLKAKPEYTKSVFKEPSAWSLCASRDIVRSQGNLVLIEDFRVTKPETILLTAKEVMELFAEDLCLIDLTTLDTTRQLDVLSLKIARANHSDLIVNNKEELMCLCNWMCRLHEDKKVIKENFGFVMQVILRNFSS